MPISQYLTSLLLCEQPLCSFFFFYFMQFIIMSILFVFQKMQDPQSNKLALERV